MEQKMKLAPRMIQSMEILQLPLLALQERIIQEMNKNPVLEFEDDKMQARSLDEDEREGSDDDALEGLDDNYKEYMDRAKPQPRPKSDEPDKKLEALKNTAAKPNSLYDHLIDQWHLVDVEEPVRKAGEKIIEYIDNRGYLTVRLEQLHNKDEDEYSLENLEYALKLIQKLEPAGVGARDIKECFLIQIDQSPEEMPFERKLVAEHMNRLMENKLPDIAKKMNCSIDDINKAIVHLSRFDTSPGLQIEQERNHTITADVSVEYDEEAEDFVIRVLDSELPALKVNDEYSKMVEDPEIEEKTKKFLKTNIRSAEWIIEAIKQRKKTLLKVTQSIVKHQREFFEKGQHYLKPLPMATVADEVGVHIATVSRAVSGKYVQCSWGVLPLRKFFSGGMEDEYGKAHSWEAIRAKLQQIIDEEDKSKPLSDDKIRKKLAEMGIKDIARRTVAKYRKILNIPSARLRKKY